MADKSDTQAQPPEGQEPAVVVPEAGVDGAQPSATAAQPQEGTKGEPSKEPAEATLDPVVLARERDDAKREAAEFRRKLRSFESKAEDDRKSKLSEDERTQEEITRLKTESRERDAELQKVRLESTLLRVAPKYNLIDPSDALWLLDWDKIEVNEETGEPTNLDTLLQELVASKPHLVRGGNPRPAPAIGSNAGSSPASPPNLTTEELAAAKEVGMAPERYAALRDAAAGKQGVTLADWMKTRAAPGS